MSCNFQYCKFQITAITFSPQRARTSIYMLVHVSLITWIYAKLIIFSLVHTHSHVPLLADSASLPFRVLMLDVVLLSHITWSSFRQVVGQTTLVNVLSYQAGEAAYFLCFCPTFEVCFSDE